MKAPAKGPSAAPAGAAAGGKSGDGASQVAAVGIAGDVVQWQRLHGRHGLPWQSTRDPYRIWLSEVMLQQTQVATVLPYFEAFVAAFPTVADLAAAQPDAVMSLWSGLGYYSRARNLHAAARCVLEQHEGRFPATAAGLATLPGIGRSTAAAIAAFAFGERAAILDGNVKRVFCRVFAVDGPPDQPGVLRRLWSHAQAELPPEDQCGASIQAYTQGLMDLGATLCTRTRPACERCPLQAKCLARRNGAVHRYPAPRPRREMAVREVDLLLLCHRQAVLIELRPPVGIWGGLWSLPEAPGALVLPKLPANPFMRFEHAFTHFRMRARVWRLELDEVQAQAALREAPAVRWLALRDAATAPLPRPVKSLLQSLERGSSLPGLD